MGIGIGVECVTNNKNMYFSNYIKMKLCFYNINHIGDIYFSSFFIKLICNLNKETNFYYYFINGDIFFENIPNIQRLGDKLEINYSDTLVNGNPPENLLNNEILNILLKNSMQRTGAKIIQYNSENILFINTWCVSEFLNHIDFDIYSAMNSYNDLIQRINKEYNLNIFFHLDNLVENIVSSVAVPGSIDLIQSICVDLDTIFIFNYVPRSIHFDMNHLNNYILELSKTNKVIVSCYNSIFENNDNIKFIDKDYNINKNPKCSNLIELWEIAVKCNKIIILPTGSSWIFLHKLNEIKENQIYMFNGIEYIKRLNTMIQFLTGKMNFINDYQ